MLVQMPLSHTPPASHSSTSAGHKGRQRPAWVVSGLCYPFPTRTRGTELQS